MLGQEEDRQIPNRVHWKARGRQYVFEVGMESALIVPLGLGPPLTSRIDGMAGFGFGLGKGRRLQGVTLIPRRVLDEGIVEVHQRAAGIEENRVQGGEQQSPGL